jgi:ATP phosphoribosyltransferase
MNTQRLKIAIQKKGRLNDGSVELLKRCGLNFEISSNALIAPCESRPIDILLVRDDDIPTLVMDGVCDAGIVGENTLFEKKVGNPGAGFSISKRLGFSRCRLSIALPKDAEYRGKQDLQNKRIATSYPALLKKYLDDECINAQIVSLAGSVEIAPRLGMADAICDLVSSGKTLQENDLRETTVLIDSQAAFIQSTQSKNQTLDWLLNQVRENNE